MLQFSYDSPIFAKKIEENVQDIDKLNNCIKNLVKLLHQFCKDLKSLSIVGNAIGVQMKQNCFTVEGQTIAILSSFGDIFKEISSSQQNFSQTLEDLLILPLEKFTKETIASVFKLRHEYVKERGYRDDKIIKYLQSDSSSAAFIRNNQTQHAQVETRALDLVNHRKNVEINRFDLIRSINEVKAKKSFELSEISLISMMAFKAHYRLLSDQIDSMTDFIPEQAVKQQAEKDIFLTSKDPLDMQRSNMISILDKMIERVDCQMPSSDNTARSEATSPQPGQSADDTNISDESNSFSSNNNMIGAASSAISKFGAMGVAMGSNWMFKRPAISDAEQGRPGKIQSMKKKTISQKSNNGSSNQLGSLEASSSSHDTVNSSFNNGSIAYHVEDMEIRMKALDNTELEYFYEKINSYKNPSIVKEGYILERGTGKLLQTVWSRRWLVLDETKLYIVKEGYNLSDQLNIQILCDVILSSVRELKNPEIPFCFEVAYANMKTYTLQAEGPKDYHSWVNSIRGAIERRLIAGPSDASSGLLSLQSPQSTIMPFSSALSQSEGQIQCPSASNAKADYVKAIMTANPNCCECGKSKPDWLSLNLGCLICIDCAGVHRSVGVHVSKVRSLTLDDLEMEEYEMIMRLGNDTNQAIWEPGLETNELGRKVKMIAVPNADEEGVMTLEEVKKPSLKDDRGVREKFIRCKYVSKSFISRSPSLVDPMEDLSLSCAKDQLTDSSIEGLYDELLVACRQDNVHKVLQLLASGLSVNGDVFAHVNESPPTVHASDSSDSLSRIPLLIAAESGAVSTVALLVLNGADVFATDRLNPTQERIPAIAIAKQSNQQDVLQYLNRKAEQLGVIVGHASSMNNLILASNFSDSATSSPSSNYGNDIEEVGDFYTSGASTILLNMKSQRDILESQVDRLKVGLEQGIAIMFQTVDKIVDNVVGGLDEETESPDGINESDETAEEVVDKLTTPSDTDETSSEPNDAPVAVKSLDDRESTDPSTNVGTKLFEFNVSVDSSSNK